MMAIGRYRVIRPLGQGGMGAVYLCEDPTLERRVAIKLLLRDPSNQGLRAEARTLAALNHKGIVTIHEVGEHEGQDFLVMEYLPGKTLRELLEAAETPRMTLLEICARVAEAVAAAHRAGILHRDIKPENILVTEDDVKVLDFGIARRLSTREAPARSSEIPAMLATAIDPEGAVTMATAATNTLYGTPAYMAPEIFHGEPSSVASDVYGLGIVVYECVAGRRPHDARTLPELIARVTEAEPARLDDPHAELIAAMLAADPASRPDLLEVSSQLAIGRTLIPGGPPPVPTRPKRGRRWFAIAAASAVVAITAGVAISTIRGQPEDRADAPAAIAPVEIALAPIEIPPGLYGSATPSSEATRALLVDMLAAADPGGLRVFTISGREHPTAAHTATIALHRDGGKLSASITLVDRASNRSESAVVTAPDLRFASVRMAPLYHAIVKHVFERLRPGRQFVHRHDPHKALQYLEAGRKQIDATQFADARTSLENAVQEDPRLFAAWYALAFAIVWQNDDDAASIAAHARELATDPVERAMMTGVVAYMRGDYAEARAELEPLLAGSAGRAYQRELLYFYGETLWHDGFRTEGAKWFARALEVDRSFRPIVIHLAQQAVVQGDRVQAALYGGLEQKEQLHFADRAYERVLDSTVVPWRLAGLEVLRRNVSERDVAVLGPYDRATYEVARALRAGDRVTAQRLFAAAVDAHYAGPALAPFVKAQLAGLVEVVVIGELVEETRRGLALLTPQQQTGPLRHELHRLAIHAAGMVKDRDLFPTGKLTHRNRLTRAAIEAELAGDQPKAAEILRGVLREPSIDMDLLERAALIRDLRALGRRREVADVCREILRPYSWRFSHLVLQRVCR